MSCSGVHSFLVGLLVICLCHQPSRGAERDAKIPERPNILFLFSDDQRADTIGALGHPVVKTPSLDGLVHCGTVFTEAHCMGAMHGAVCVPSRAMLMTGRSLFNVDESLKSMALWPQQFAKAGYATFMTGKWHNPLPAARRAFQTGKSVFVGGMTVPTEAKVVDFTEDQAPTTPTQVAKHCVEVFADQAIEFIHNGNHPHDKPWLCYVSFNAPHDPCLVPEDFPVRYDEKSLPLPPNHLLRHPFDNGELEVRDEKLIAGDRTVEAVKRELAAYYRAISFMDAQIGRILDALAKSGQAEKTIIVFASDHGLAKGSHGLLGKQNLYEHSMRSPLIFCGPGLKGGQTSAALCYLYDIFPTLGELSKVTPPLQNEGLSLLPQLRDPSRPARDHLFTAYRGLQRAVRDDRWKLIHYTVKGQETWQLFDLKTDPHEIKNLATESTTAAELEKMKHLLSQSQSFAGDDGTQRALNVK